MNKQELVEIRKTLSQNNCTIMKICGCYVDAGKEIKATFVKSFLSLPEEEMERYLEIFRKTLSGKIGRQQHSLDIPLCEEKEGGTQTKLVKLLDNFPDAALLEEFYGRIVSSFQYDGQYLVLLVQGSYDVPGYSGDDVMLEDQEEVYRHLLACICPVKLSKEHLSYLPSANDIVGGTGDWVVGMPEAGFLFPSFNGRAADIHSIQYYTKGAEGIQEGFSKEVLGCTVGLTAKEQKDLFGEALSNASGGSVPAGVLLNFHGQAVEEMEEVSRQECDSLEAVKGEKVASILEKSGASADVARQFAEEWGRLAGDGTAVSLGNLADAKVAEIRTQDAVTKINACSLDKISFKIVDGRKCIVVDAEGALEVDGLQARFGEACQ